MISAGALKKIKIFREFFSGLTHVYGTCDPNTGRTWQAKEPVTDETILAHLKGRRPYGVFLLTDSRTRAVAADFDDPDPFPPVEFVNAANHYGLPAYIETSKSKGFHVWIFFDPKGVEASKARVIVKRILEEIDCPQTEIFPKQDRLDGAASYGNFIFAPLFGRLVSKGKTVFIDPYTLRPYKDQWKFLETAKRAAEPLLDEIIELNTLEMPKTHALCSQSQSGSDQSLETRFRLPPCARAMLKDGVSQYQRVSCFRLAVHLKRLGLPQDVAASALVTWAMKNRPYAGKRIITKGEILEQISYAFARNYRTYGCESEAIKPFCDTRCPVRRLYRG
jgi:hypothetical protein